MKRLICILLLIAFIISMCVIFASCDGDEEKADNESKAAAAPSIETEKKDSSNNNSSNSSSNNSNNTNSNSGNTYTSAIQDNIQESNKVSATETSKDQYDNSNHQNITPLD